MPALAALTDAFQGDSSTKQGCIYLFHRATSTLNHNKQLSKALLATAANWTLERTLSVRHGPQDMQIQVALKWAEGTYSWWSVLLSVFHIRSLPSWAHKAKYCRVLGEKTQGSCTEELPPSAAISKTLLESACVVYTNHVFPSQNMRGSVNAPRVIFQDTPTWIINIKHFSVKVVFLTGIRPCFLLHLVNLSTSLRVSLLTSR